MQLKIEYVPINELKTYENNAKIHTAEQIEQIKNSIQQFGMDDPIAVWKDNVIVEGHGRLIACKELGISEVPVIRLDHLTDEQRRVYAVVHNKLTMNTKFDIDILGLELEGLADDFDLTDLGFNEAEILEFTVDDSPEEIPSLKDLYPQYDAPEENKEEERKPVEIPQYNNNVQPPVFAPQITKEELRAYERNAEQLVSRRVIIVFRTDDEEQYIRQLFGISDDKPLGVVYDIETLIKNNQEGGVDA